MTRPTPRGVGLLAVAAGTYVVARTIGTWELYMLAAAFAALVALAWVQARATERRLQITRSLTPRQPVTGDPLRFSFTVENRSPVPGQRVTLLRGCGPFDPHDRPVPVDRLGARGRRTVACGPWPARRGIHHLPPFEVAVEDPLRIARARAPRDPLDLIVPPRLAHLESCALFIETGIGADARRRLPTPQGYEFHGLRPYSPGEPLNRVDWKATAKTSSLMLRETEDAADSDVTVLLNGVASQVAGEPTATNFELAVRAAGSIADYALRTGRAATLLIPEGDWLPVRLAPGAGGRVRLLETLAATNPEGLSQLGPRVRHLVARGRPLQRGQSLALVLLALDVELARELISLRRCGLRVAVVHVPAAPFGRPSPRLTASDFAAPVADRPGGTAADSETGNLAGTLQAAGVTYRALGPDDDLNAVLALPNPVRAGAALPSTTPRPVRAV
jgi:uncharacterized protein (DUF58 family)